ncbi:MAG: Gfo/Idh/MocA family oxidoreductase [Flavobacteriales bacterium]|nr:Gfo/Idh/MocA family oxidoreductase [Flavobacteriales bacterium]
MKYVCENHKGNASACKHAYSDLNVVADFETLLNDDDLDAIVLATPVDTHYALSKAALNAGKHVLIEKILYEIVGRKETKKLKIKTLHKFHLKE